MATYTSEAEARKAAARAYALQGMANNNNVQTMTTQPRHLLSREDEIKAAARAFALQGGSKTYTSPTKLNNKASSQLVMQSTNYKNPNASTYQSEAALKEAARAYALQGSMMTSHAKTNRNKGKQQYFPQSKIDTQRNTNTYYLGSQTIPSNHSHPGSHYNSPPSFSNYPSQPVASKPPQPMGNQLLKISNRGKQSKLSPITYTPPKGTILSKPNHVTTSTLSKYPLHDAASGYQSTLSPVPIGAPKGTYYQLHHNIDLDDYDEEYAKFVRSLIDDDQSPSSKSISINSHVLNDDDDDEEEYNSEEDDEDNEDDDDDDDEDENNSSSANASDNLNVTKSDIKGEESATLTQNHSVQTPITNKIGQSDVLDDAAWEFDHEALEAELGSLFDEDYDAAVNTLLNVDIDRSMFSDNHKMPSTPLSLRSSAVNYTNGAPAATSKNMHPSMSVTTTPPASETHPTLTPSQLNNRVIMKQPLKTTNHTIPSEDQIQLLQKLMSQHYQILLQQTVLAIRAAHGNKFQTHEEDDCTPFSTTSNIGTKRKRQNDASWNFSDLSENDLLKLLDGAVSMLQDMDQNRKDCIRNIIQMERAKRENNNEHNYSSQTDGSGGGLFSSVTAASSSSAVTPLSQSEEEQRIAEEYRPRGWLTRSAFSKRLRESEYGDFSLDNAVLPNFGKDPSLDGSRGNYTMNTVFGVRGLARLKETFDALDNSLHPIKRGLADVDVFSASNHGKACELLLQHARADYDDKLLPGMRPLSELLSYPAEVFKNKNNADEDISDEESYLRENRSQFTAAEDNLVLRGVNLYGEKEWTLISERFLPDRNLTVVAQRFWRLCFLIYKANGIHIDAKGNFKEPPVFPRGPEDFDKAKVATLKPVKKPLLYNLYRWSFEEDITLLKAVPIMGRLFAEISKRLIPHRDRGVLRKRYQVLERRVKGSLKREKKNPKIDLTKRKKTTSSSKRVKSSSGPKTKKMKTAPATSQDKSRTSGGIVKHGFAEPSTSSQIASTHESFPRESIPITASKEASSITNDKTKTFSLPQGFTKLGAKPLHPGYHISMNISSTNTNGQVLQSDGLNSNNDESTTDVSSRLTIDRLIDGEWSQMSNMTKLMGETTDLSRMASGRQTHPPMERLPVMHYDDSMSGLSVLNNLDSHIPDASRRNNTGSIMSNVLSKTIDINRNGVTRSVPHESSTLPISYSKDVYYDESMSGLSILHNLESHIPDASRKNTGSIMSNVLSKTNTVHRNGIPQPFSNDKRNLLANAIPNNKNCDSNLLNRYVKMAPSYPSANSHFSSLENPKVALNQNHECSVDGFNFSNLSFGEESRQTLGQTTIQRLCSSNLGPPGSPPGIMHSLMSPDVDYDAALALNQMSNSSVPFFSNNEFKPQQSVANTTDKSEPKEIKSPTKTKSFFQKVRSKIKEK